MKHLERYTKADKFNNAVLEVQQQLLSEQKPATAQSLNAVLNLPVDSAARLYDRLAKQNRDEGDVKC